MVESEQDKLMRAAAFDEVRRLSEIHGHLTTEQLKPGFNFDGKRYPLIHPMQGIHRPKGMPYLLSIKTRFPNPGEQPLYDDQREVYKQIEQGKETIQYAFRGKDPKTEQNRWLYEAGKHNIPIIYFLGIAPRCFVAVYPVFISGWDPFELKARVEFGKAEGNELTPPPDSVERRYAVYEVRKRLHQALFREAVISAYRGRCAISGLPEKQLLDAAHIIPDKDEKLGQPIVPNGLPLSKIHHAAFDAHLIGIDRKYKVHVSERLLIQHDGPMLESLKKLHGRELIRPRRNEHLPDPKRLAKRFKQFRSAA